MGKTRYYVAGPSAEMTLRMLDRYDKINKNDLVDAVNQTATQQESKTRERL